MITIRPYQDDYVVQTRDKIAEGLLRVKCYPCRSSFSCSASKIFISSAESALKLSFAVISASRALAVVPGSGRPTANSRSNRAAGTLPARASSRIRRTTAQMSSLLIDS